MDVTVIISFTSASGTSIPAVSSRPFTTAFMLTLFGRLVYEAHLSAAGGASSLAIPALADVPALNLPLWLISEMTIIIFGLLMAVEWYGDYSADLRVMLEDVKTNLVKPGVSAVLQFGLVQGQGAVVLQLLALHLPPATLAWLLSISPGVPVASVGAGAAPMPIAALSWLATVVAGMWAVLMAGVTWLAAGLRQSAIDLLTDLDEDDSLGLMKLLSLAEGGWTITLMMIMVFLPLIALALAGITILSLFLIRKWFERREERAKVRCGACGSAIYPSALFCPACRQPNESPRAVGVFGQTKAVVVTDRTAHHLNLVARKRCPCCATRLPAKTISQPCAACGTVTFASLSAANRYLRALDKKLPFTLLVCGVLGALPLIGIVLGVVYYRLSLIASLRAYIPRTTGCLTRWGLRFLMLFLIGLQPFMLGWLTLPAMALVNYVVYRQVLKAGFPTLTPNSVPPSTGLGGGAVAVAGGVTLVLSEPAPTPALPMPSAGQRGCPACGTVNPIGYRFCTTCGNPMGDGAR